VSLSHRVLNRIYLYIYKNTNNNNNNNYYYYYYIFFSFCSLWSSIWHPWRASKRCDLQLSPWPHSMIFLYFLFHPLLSFATFSSTYLFFYYPWGFESNAVFSIASASLRNVCPIQFHFLIFIWISIGFCLVILHSSSFVILFFHFILIIRLKHLFINGRVQFFNLISPAHQMVIIVWRHVLRFFCILILPCQGSEEYPTWNM